MFEQTKAFSGFSVDDMDRAREFYGDTLGIEIEDVPPHGLIRLKIEGGNPILVYPKEDHEPATFTILNFPVADVEGTVASLRERGVEFQRYEGTQMETGEDGIFRGGGPLIAWFEDPAGNVLSVVEG
ncbi:MAG: VOC family protein [Solirubrobacterales bacterium]